MYGVYILRSLKDKGLYVGYSDDVKRRLIEHKKGKVLSTHSRRPLDLIYCELYKSRKDAMRRERFFKSGWGRNYIKKILHDTLSEK
jgi:putative endonuclease